MRTANYKPELHVIVKMKTQLFAIVFLAIISVFLAVPSVLGEYEGGLKGDNGDQGGDGSPGLKGPPGPQGFKSELGIRGETVSIGLVGQKGDKGDKGDMGDEGYPGICGMPGLPGARGPKGLDGRPGEDGFPGLPGLEGIQGERGLPGYPGPLGLKGDQGLYGLPGISGFTGQKGEPGKSCTQVSNYLTRTLIVRHSQSKEVPRCESGHTRLWEGYSLLFVSENQSRHRQDLGMTGSCVRRFATLPFISCHGDECKYVNRNEKSCWLSTSASIPMMPVKETAIQDYISRCVVCETLANVFTVHSQSQSLPDCPIGWSSLWTGYSFVMHKSSEAIGGGQSLSDTGSCLEHFKESPFIQCNGVQGHCHNFSNPPGFWQITIEDRVSRCQVCIKD